MLPQLNFPRRSTTSINVFRGLNRSPNTGFSRVNSSSSSIYTEFKDMENMSTDIYPQLSPRGSRSKVCLEDGLEINSNLLATSKGLIYSYSNGQFQRGSSVYAGTTSDGTAIINNDEENFFVAFGNKLVCFPERYSVTFTDTAYATTALDVTNAEKQCVSTPEQWQKDDGTYYKDWNFQCSIVRSYYDETEGKTYYPLQTLFREKEDLESNLKYQQKPEISSNYKRYVSIFFDIRSEKYIGKCIENGSSNSFLRVTDLEEFDEDDVEYSNFFDGKYYTFEELNCTRSYTTILATGIGVGINKGDYVKISGITNSLHSNFNTDYIDEDFAENFPDLFNDQYFKVYDVNNNMITIKLSLSASIPYTGTVTVERIMPDFDDGLILENENRLWCCSSKNNEIYCCKLGDETNWKAYSEGISTDAYAATCGRDGDFTGIAARNGSVYFFKENYIFKLVGTKPSNFTLTEYCAPGVAKGSERSIVNIGSTFYYLGVDGVYAYQSGSLPTKISEGVMWGGKYENGVAGKCGSKYYLSVHNITQDKQELLIYDTAKGIWTKEDSTKFIDCAAYNNRLYWVDEYEDGIICSDDADGSLLDTLKQATMNIIQQKLTEDSISWAVETGDLYDSEFAVKNIGKIRIGLKAESGTVIKLFAQYKDNGEFIKLAEMLYSEKKPRVFSVALRRAEYLRIRLEGSGQAEIYGIDIEHSSGSDKRGSI